MTEEILITGGCGFVGHHIVEHFLKNTDYVIHIIDKLTYASNGFDRLRDIGAYQTNRDRVRIYASDLGSEIPDGVLKEVSGVRYLIHLAAESHVDRAIEDPLPCVISNVVGTAHILQFARKLPKLERFVYFSTDEVFGPAPEGVFYQEWDRYNSTNPYSASKAGGEELALAWANTYGLPVIITHTMNVFGERQHPEKFIPMCIKKIRAGDEVTIHANADKTKSGSRHYIHARNVASAVDHVLAYGVTRDKYNIVGEREISNLDLACFIATHLNLDLKYELVDFHSCRPGHDLRYALSGERLRGMGWEPPKTFEDSLARTIDWFLENPGWLV